jgi:hypothetical protein
MTDITVYDYGIKPARGGDEFGENPPVREEVEACKEWLTRYASKPKTRNKRRAVYSYGLKHIIERGCESGYVSNGAAIQAAVDLGYEFCQHEADNINVSFFMRLRLPADYPKHHCERQAWPGLVRAAAIAPWEKR